MRDRQVMIKITVIDSSKKKFDGNDIAIKDEVVDEGLGCRWQGIQCRSNLLGCMRG